MSEVKRDAKGRLLKGSTANKRGRPPRQTRRHTIPERNRDSLFGIAEMEVTINVNGKPEKRTLYEANVIRLGFDGVAGKISSARAFVNAVNRAADENGQFSDFVRMLLQNMNELEQENAQLRKFVPRNGVLRLDREVYDKMFREQEARKLVGDEDEAGKDKR